jgi:fibronectin type 3 domain-containing protein
MLRLMKIFIVCSLFIIFSILSCSPPGNSPELPTGKDEARLSTLSVSVGSLSPAFQSDCYYYAVTVANSVKTLSLTPVAEDEKATITVNDKDTASSAQSAEIPLKIGSTEIKVTVVCQNKETKVYTISVTRADSATARLASLAVTGVELSPGFSPEIYAYTMTVDHNTDSITVTATAEDENSIIKVNGNNVGSGQPSEEIPLATGNNEIAVNVEAKDGSENLYTLIIRVLSGNANLKGLSVSAGELKPAFAPETTDYTLAVGNTVISISVLPEADDPLTIITVGINLDPPAAVKSGEESLALMLSIGGNKIVITGTAEDGATKTYSVFVERAAFLPPANISASQDDLDRVLLSWDAASDAEKYLISRSNNPDAGFSVLAETSGLSYADITAAPGVKYYYRIRSWNSLNGESLESASYLGYRTIAPPQAVEASEGLADRISICWDAVEEANSYEVYRATASVGTYTLLAANIKQIAYDDFSCTPGILYDYRIKAAGIDVSGDYSAPDSGYRDIADPTNLIATDNLGKKEIDLDWTAVEGATAYFVYRSTSSMEDYIQIGNTATNSYADTTMNFNTTYYYKVRTYAESAAIYSDYSNYDSGYCILQAPANVAATDTLADKIQITWAAVPGAERYDIMRAELAGSYTTIGSSTTTTYDDTTAVTGVKYNYLVAAVSGVLTACDKSDQGIRTFSAPVDVDASTGYTKKIVLKWRPVPGATLYRIYRSTYAWSDYSIWWATSNNTYSDTSIKNQTYYYKVTACNADGTAESEQSAMATGSFSGSYIEAPEGIAASDGTYTDRVRIIWNSVSGAVRYDIYKFMPATGSYELIGNTTTSLWFEDTDVSPATNYYYKLKAYNGTYISGFTVYDTGFAQ